MYKVPAKFKRNITSELKKFTTVIRNLQSKGKSSSEDDARIILNDMLADALGYDKYNELKTELREKNGRLDYIVKLSEGPLAKKPNQFDFVIEAKAAHVTLNQNHINQTLQYCLSKGVDYFVLTNAVKWQLYSVKNTKRNSDAELVHEVNFGVENDLDSLAEEFYLFSKNAYLNGDWKNVQKVAKATKVEDVVAIIMSDKIIKSIAREIKSIHDVKVSEDQVKDLIENQVIKAEVGEINKRLLKKINQKPTKTKVSTKATSEDSSDDNTPKELSTEATVLSFPEPEENPNLNESQNESEDENKAS